MHLDKVFVLALNCFDLSHHVLFLSKNFYSQSRKTMELNAKSQHCWSRHMAVSVCSGTEGEKQKVAFIWSCVYPPIMFSKRHPRLSSTRVTLWFGKYSYDCFARVNLLLTAVTLFAHVIFHFVCFYFSKMTKNAFFLSFFFFFSF